MSSSSHVAVRLRNGVAEGGNVLNLKQLGENAPNRLIETIERLPATVKELELDAAAATKHLLNWLRDETKPGNEYVLTLPAQEVYRLAGSQASGTAEVRLTVSGETAKVTYHSSYQERYAGSVREGTMEGALRRTAHRAVNQLVALTVANDMRERVRLHPRVQSRQEVRLSVANRQPLMIRAYANVAQAHN